METKCAKKCEETIQQEIEIIRTKYEEIIKTLKMKISITQNENVEYLNAIKVQHCNYINFNIFSDYEKRSEMLF